MEQPFYHDDSLLSAYSRAEHGPLKAFTSLNEPYRAAKPELCYYPEQPSLKMSAPELERLIIHSGPGVINSATSASGGQQLFYRGGTEEQEGFVDGFVRALDDLHKMNRDGPPNVSLGGGTVPMTTAAGSPVGGGAMYADPAVYTNLASYNCYRPPSTTINYLPHSYAGGPPFKEEPQTVPEGSSRGSTPTPLSPIDMEQQEKIKVERKRLRNRLAATKCRKRKLERIARLEDKVRELKSENSGLSGTAGALREQVEQLKIRVREHVRHGCQLLLSGKEQLVF